MEIIYSVKDMQQIANRVKRSNTSIGFVPTMGYLHEGHLSLIKQAREDNDIAAVSIFVNPMQFSPNEDLNKYPRDFERDEMLCEQNGVDYLFYPGRDTMYPDGFETYVSVDKLTKVLEGASRPAHFRGVTTVVNKLFNIIKPDRAYFGKKDAQQLLVIKKMVKDLNMDIEIVGMPIVREEDGLAMSSRNKYLNSDERKDAVCLHRALNRAEELKKLGIKSADKIKNEMKTLIESYEHTKIDYININKLSDLSEISNVEEGGTLISLAVFVGSTRLIDNIWI